MKVLTAIIGSSVMALLVVGVHSLVQFVIAKEMPDLLEWRKVLLFAIVFIGCFGLTKGEVGEE
ncbi:hypothetical protein OXB_2709 [Bacillus sp. OxB-1]|uniref:hypothetical protein n=1 Tax=Bacillus sp. (strain OxB-1) TaxID=98228 RepID=UPI000581DE75|nr:hypothetical protein [Bacillus sp. OxB-1]BAQ11180.1 hypothetical protein OXB_2709 [Bacillus sp. OxB-1]